MPRGAPIRVRWFGLGRRPDSHPGHAGRGGPAAMAGRLGRQTVIL